jgi:glycosyltransferase involved in cell wall biosynthesis
VIDGRANVEGFVAPIRVVHVTPYFAPAFRYGGPPRSVLGLCQGLQRAGVEVEVVTTTANGDTELSPSPASGDWFGGVKVHYCPSAFPRRFFGAALTRTLQKALAEADLCHVHGLWNVPEWRATRLASSVGVPYVLSPRGMLHPAALARGAWRKRVAFGLLERRSLAGAALLHATASEEAEILGRVGSPDRVLLVPNGVDVNPGDVRGDMRLRLGIPPDAPVSRSRS